MGDGRRETRDGRQDIRCGVWVGVVVGGRVEVSGWGVGQQMSGITDILLPRHPTTIHFLKNSRHYVTPRFLTFASMTWYALTQIVQRVPSTGTVIS